MNLYQIQQPFYCGIDLHANEMYACVVDQDGKKLLHRNFKTRQPEKVRAVLDRPTAAVLEASPKLLEVEKWSPEGDTVALRNSTFKRRQQPTGRPPWMTVIFLRPLGKFLPAKLETSFGSFFGGVSAR